MTDEKPVELERGPASVRTYVYRALDLLSRELRERAERNGGLLSTVEIDVAVDAFKRAQSAAIGGICRAAWDECGVLFDSEQRGEDRKSAFERLLVRPFEYLLADDTAVAGESLSRRVIPGYLAAVQEITGPIVFGRHQERCKDLVHLVRDARGNAFTWDDVYTDSASTDIVDDILTEVAGNFGEFEKQRERFIRMVNNAMPASGNGTGEAQGFSPADFSLMMSALYASLSDKLVTQAGEEREIERYNAEKVAQIKALLAALHEE
jgi:hypothetical protein